MKMEICAIRDRQLNGFMQPFFTQSKGQAIRAFSDLVNDKQHPVGQHPEDYDLWHLGSWTDDDGRFHQTSEGNGPQQIAVGTNYINVSA